jgi:hypothetical protein
MSIKTFLYILLSIIILVSVSATIFNFIGVDFSEYGNYLMWIIALIIFYMVLPKSQSNAF